ncbi:hypothetical protein [Streptomyces aurantiogriseus]|uniref:Uncharacterized protein n=1 Tax=Streptomyces aurantiogriseus TaxID=66870 RepID=A0A918F195_9ACTN|nr:hypothetical protein [Streptomyces aurantiogriseus]GGQ91573.1 hypothetical protein GCM10010251_02520 [Streptomyces aurantiogriseus]
MTVNVPVRRRRQGPSPLEGERIRRLSRSQVEDLRRELGDLYAETAGGDPSAWNQDRVRFLRRLAVDVRRPGFALLVAESAVLQGSAGAESAGAAEIPGRWEVGVLTGCAYGFPVRADGPWWRGLDGYLPRDLLRLAAAGRLFVISGLVVHSQVRTQDPGREWNLARRLQRRLLADRTAGLTGRPAVLGVTLVDRGDTGTLQALRSWGWRSVTTDPDDPAPALGPCRALVFGP